MKQFKSIQYLSESEFSDFMYFRTNINQNKSKLKFNISSIANPYFNKNVPHIMVFGDDNLNYLNYKTYNNYAIVKISPNPYLILNNLNLSETDLLDIFKFIKLNKKILMKYWNWKCSSRELKNNIKEINETNI